MDHSTAVRPSERASGAPTATDPSWVHAHRARPRFGSLRVYAWSSAIASPRPLHPPPHLPLKPVRIHRPKASDSSIGRLCPKIPSIARIPIGLSRSCSIPVVFPFRTFPYFPSSFCTLPYSTIHRTLFPAPNGDPSSAPTSADPLTLILTIPIRSLHIPPENKYDTP